VTVGAAKDVLVICYGNPLRSDDGVGWRVAELLAEDPRAAGAEVLARHQLTPELAEDVSRAGLVVLVDASGGPGAAGSVSSNPLGASPASGSVYSHHVDPVLLLQLAGAWFGHAPPAVQVSIRAAQLGAGTGLSAPVAAAMPALVDAVIDAIGLHGRVHA
jgi:hydrogenase maturation protease